MPKESNEASLTNLLKGNTALFVLSALKERPSHGYAIFSELARRSNNILRFKQGTVYPLLHSLENEGLIRSEWQEGTREAPRRRRVYVITDEGLAELDRRLNTWRLFSQLMSDLTGVKPARRSSKRASGKAATSVAS